MYFSKLLITDILEFAIENGANKDDLVKRLGINPNKEFGANEVVSYETMAKILRQAGESISDLFLGLHLGEKILLKGTSQVDEIMKHSPSIEDAFTNAVDYSKLISDALSCGMEKTDHYTKISFQVNPNWALIDNYSMQQIIDLSLVRTFKSLYSPPGKKYNPAEVHLNLPNQKKRAEYYRVFDCRIKFNQATTAILFHNPILNQTLPEHDSGLLSHLKKIGNEEIEKLKTGDPLILQIKSLLLENLPQKSTLEGISKELSLSSRTLQRKLKAKKTSFKRLEKDVLLKLAKKFLLSEKRTMDEISYFLGFSEASAFIRFFKNEMNISPKNFMKKENLKTT